MFDASFKKNPYNAYHRMVGQNAVHYVQLPNGVLTYLVTGYDAAIKTFTHPDLCKSHLQGNPRWRGFSAIMPEPQHTQLQANLFNQDAPRHTEMRRLIMPTFAPERIEGFRDRIAAHVDSLLDALIDKPKVDLMRDFASRLPLLVLSDVIGLSDAHRVKFKREWSRANGPVSRTNPGRDEYLTLLTQIHAYLETVIEESREGNPESLIVQLIAAHDAGKLSSTELLSMIFQLLVMGQEPVINQIGNAILALLQDPAAMQQLVDNPVLDDKAVTELLRLNSSVELGTWRFFSKTTNLMGTSIPAGDPVLISISAANRDERRFECPHKLNLQRENNVPLTFGYDHHKCPAEYLARLQLEISLQQIIRRLPNLKLAVPYSELKWNTTALIRGMKKLPVTFGEKAKTQRARANSKPTGTASRDIAQRNF
jgi:cytochrome P450